MLKSESNQEKRNEMGKGSVLVGLGVLFLVAQLVDFSFVGQAMPLLLGLIFIAVGIVTRKSGFMIPGGILSGIGLGTVVAANGIGSQLSWLNGGNNDDILFMVCFGLGWASIPVLSGLFTSTTHWWAFIPAAIFLSIAGALTFGGIFETMLSLAGKLWPLLLVAAGVSILVKERRNSDDPQISLKA